MAGGATTADPQMQKVRAANPEALFMTGITTGPNLLILKSYRQLGFKTPVLANYNLSVPVYMTAAKGLLDGITFVDAFDPSKPATQRFIEAYKKDTGAEPYNLIGYGYDGMMMVANAITRAGSTDSEKVRTAMQATRGYKGVMGSADAVYGFAEGKRTGFDANGMVVRVYEGDKQGRVLHIGVK